MEYYRRKNGESVLICDIAIDSQDYYSSDSSLDHLSHDHNGGKGYHNNYALSNIRKWLNETFYNTAFNEPQKSIIQTTKVNNSALSTDNIFNGFACKNTQDKVYLLSYKEATTYYSSNGSRQKMSSDYAKSQGCLKSTDKSCLKNCNWWLRSPDYTNSSRAHHVGFFGGIINSYVNSTFYGVVPSLKIKL